MQSDNDFQGEEVMKMKSGTAFLIAWTVVLCASANFAANGLDITFFEDGVISDGESYDDVFVYGDTTVVDVKGGTVGKLWSRDGSTVNISGGRVTYAQSYDRSTINISGGTITEPSIWDAGGTVNVSGGICWNIRVRDGELNMTGGQVTGIGIYTPAPGGVVKIYGYGFEYYPFPGRSDGRLKGYWLDDTSFDVDFLSGAYEAVVLYERARDFVPVADAGQDQTAVAVTGTTAEATLDGSASSDPDGDELTYLWTWTINGNVYSAIGANPTITLPLGNHVIKLIVSDGTANSDTDEVVVAVLTLTQQLDALRADKLQVLEKIDTMLKKEQQVVDALAELLAGGDLGGLALDDIVAVRENIHLSMQHQEQAKKTLQKGLEKLEGALLLLGSPLEP
jgi:hypothetical protein